MLTVLRHRTYRHLFLAQLVALFGTGLASVALGLLAFDLAGARAGVVLGTALTIKMVAYVTIAPIAAAFAEHIPRRRLLVTLDLVRAGVALCLPFVTEIWQIYVLIFLLQSASAGFTPAFQATIPGVLQDEEDYTNALSLSRMAMDAESLLSPLFAALLLAFIGFDLLFVGTSLGFVASAVLLVSVVLPNPEPGEPRGAYDRITKGLRIYLKTPRLRGLLALNWVVSAIGAMVFVNTVVLVRGELGLEDRNVAAILACFGAGSMIAALATPPILRRVTDRTAMIAGSAFGTLALLATGVMPLSVLSLALGWFGVGLGYSLTLTPSGRVLTRSAHPEDRAAVFAAQFTLSHACWLIFYPLSGWLMLSAGPASAMVISAALATLGIIGVVLLWPSGSGKPMPHRHDDLPPDHPHLRGKGDHKHPIIIDPLHPTYPR